VEGAFAVRRKLAEKLALAREEEIVLVDDVLTTGATMDACAVSLREQGFVNISAFTLART
jgi:predicted amidophosphoribosyltransferase